MAWRNRREEEMAGNGERKRRYSMKKQRENLEESVIENQSGENRPKAM
jgi:hypothetical protein